MNLTELSEAANKALQELDLLTSKNGTNDALGTIKAQIEFIQKHSDNHENPKAHLGENKFTYAVVASRELASPDEMILQGQLDEITVLLKKLPAN